MSEPQTAGASIRADPPLRELFVTGLGWTAGSFGGLRLIAFGQTIILARLLSPADFGGFAMASLSVNIGQVFASMGIAQAVVQSRLEDRPTLDAAFCINLVRGILLYATLFFAAPFIEGFYGTPGVSLWTRVLALTVLFESASNVGMVLYTKELDYRRAALYGQLPLLVAAISAPVFAVWFRNAWALVLGQVTAALVQLPFSYWAHPYRPRLRVDRAALRHLLEYARFLLGSAPLFYLSAHVDEIAIGRRFGSHAMGAYQLAYNTAALPATYLSELVAGVLFPVFARLQSMPAALRAAYLKAIRHVANVSLPVSVSLFVFAEEYIRLVYGTRWLESIPLLQAFFLYGAIRPLASASLQVFRAVGATQAIFRLAIVNLAGVSWMVFVGLRYGPIWVALLLSVLSLPAIVYGWQLTATALGLRTVDILRSCAPAVLASAVALVVALLARPWLATWGSVPVRLAAGVAVVGLAYVPALLLLDRRWAAEVGDLAKARWPSLARGA